MIEHKTRATVKARRDGKYAVEWKLRCIERNDFRGTEYPVTRTFRNIFSREKLIEELRKRRETTTWTGVPADIERELSS